MLLKLLILAGLFFAAPLFAAEVTVQGLRCESRTDPLGVDAANPRLDWLITSARRGEAQTAYRVLVASSKERLDQGQGDQWDSGKVLSDQSIQVEYAGQPLAAATPYFWKVRVWDKDGLAGAWSAPATFTTGLFTQADWRSAQWIAFRPEEQWRAHWDQAVAAELKGTKPIFPWLTGQGRTIWEHHAAARPAYDPSPLFRKEFVLDRPLRRATLYICGLGYCEAFLNGQKIGDQVLDPAWTCYQKRAFYVTHDLSARLRPGVNALGAMLGRGQFSPLCNDIWGLRRAAWVGQPRLIARLSIVFADGTTQDITTDSTWRTAGGPIIYDDTRHGEIYDARLAPSGWSAAGFDDRAWPTAAVVNARNPLQAQAIPPIREFPALDPVRRLEQSGQVALFDFGRNLAGWARVTVHGPPGAKVLVDYAEVPFDPQLRGNLPGGRPAPALAHPDDPFRDLATHVRQQNGYILKGGGGETFSCHFSYKGFQFIRVTADDGVVIDRVQAVPVHSDVATAGAFTCSNPLLNRIQRAVRQTFLNNFHSIQTDCPHREKQGWTADLYLTDQAAMFNFDLAAFYAKWATDLADTQDAAGGLGVVAPSCNYIVGGSTVWPAAMVCLPADLVAFYGDLRTVTRHYEAMKRFAKSSLKRQVPGKPEIISDALGDWASPLDQPAANGDSSVMVPPEGTALYGTAAHFRVVSTLADLARRLGKTGDAREFDAWSKRIAAAFNREFFAAGQNQYHGAPTVGYRQSANAVPLAYGLVPLSARAAILGRLAHNVHVTRGDRLNTGFVGTPALLDVLAGERPDLAYALATQTAYPSWGHMMRSGATTLYETYGGDCSHNHPMYGCISAYFFGRLAGIRPDPAAPGFHHFLIQPAMVGGLTWVKAHYDSSHGRIVSNWQRESGRVTMEVTIPANSTATVFVPTGTAASVTESGIPAAQANGVTFLRREGNAAVFAVGSGCYRFQAMLLEDDIRLPLVLMPK